MNQEAINQARLLYYAFFAKILDFVEKEEAYADIEALLDIFSQNPLDESTQEAFLSIKNHLKTEGFGALKQEYDDVFVSPESSFIPLSASYYEEGRDDGQKKSQSSRVSTSFKI